AELLSKATERLGYRHSLDHLLSGWRDSERS
ncbi:hypothetical protein AK812_SmicGene48981, partial [Symbiodinium microadriaticum]